MGIIERNKWKLHPEVIKFWEDKGKRICCYGDYWQYEGREAGGATYFYELDAPQISVSASDNNVIASHNRGEISYRLDGRSYSEEIIIKIIKLKAFL
jgi:hypothetical protein